MGYVAVATLIGSGLVNSWFLVGSVRNLLNTPYGQILLTKVAVFAAMLALAAANRFWLVPSMSGRLSDGSSSSRWLRNHVFAEQFLGVMLLLAVSFLGTLRLAAGQ